MAAYNPSPSGTTGGRRTVCRPALKLRAASLRDGCSLFSPLRLHGAWPPFVLAGTAAKPRWDAWRGHVGWTLDAGRLAFCVRSLTSTDRCARVFWVGNRKTCRMGVVYVVALGTHRFQDGCSGIPSGYAADFDVGMRQRQQGVHPELAGVFQFVIDVYDPFQKMPTIFWPITLTGCELDSAVWNLNFFFHHQGGLSLGPEVFWVLVYYRPVSQPARVCRS